MLKNFLAGIILVSLLISTGLSAQIQIDTTMTPQELVENVLLGGGITVSNITFNGLPANILNGQTGKYIGPSNLIDFNEGVLLKTGLAFQAEDASFNALFPDPNITSDSDLEILSGQNILNAAILEFDFVPNGDSLMFRYVFASREYPSFTCSDYNDVFGFFISGAGINGPFSNNSINLALIPGTDIPVGINTLNSGMASSYGDAENCVNANPDWVEHSMYFVDNVDEPDGDIQFPGMTTTLTAFAVVECGQTYHIKIAIADANDFAFDSGVFLEAGSFTSNSGVKVYLDTPGGINNSTLNEGCGTASLQFIRPSETSGVQEIAYLYFSGTALNGIDFVPALPDSVVFPIGVDTVFYELFAPLDPNFGGEQYVDIDIEITNIASECSESVITSTFRFYINRVDPLEVNGFDGALVDCHDEIKLFPTVAGGYGEYIYNWSNGMSADTITVSPGQSTTYFVTVSDTCGVPGIQTSFDVEVPIYPPVLVDLGNDFEVIQCDSTVDIIPEVSGGFGAYSYYWTVNDEFISDAQNLHSLIEHTSQIKLIVTDDCGTTGSNDITINIPEMEVTAFLPDAFKATSCLTEILLPAISEGGIGQRTHIWSVDGVAHDTSLAAFFIYHPSMGQHVQMKAVDECGSFGIDSTFIPFDYPEVNIITSRDTIICPKTSADLRVNVLSGSGGYKIDWGDSDSATYKVKPKGDKNYNVVVTDTCGMTAGQTINVEVRNVRADFDYEYIPYYGLDLTNYSRAIEPEFLWNFGDDETSTLRNPRHLYKELIPYRITLTVTDNIGCKDITGLNTVPPLEIFIPTSFTPNGDGINDLFEVKGANVTEFTMRIYDRWGSLVFQTSDINEKWDGSNSKDSYHSGASVYNYIIRYRGEKEEDTKEVTGIITVIR